MRTVFVPASALALTLIACGSCESSPDGGAGFRYASLCQVGQAERSATAIRLTDAFAGRTFEMPIDLTHFRDGTRRIAIAERAGRVLVAHPDGRVTTALDISDKVYPAFECGFLGLATHPQHAQNRKIYAHYCTRPAGRTISRIAEWTMRDDDTIDPASERTLLELEQPWDNHNGGALAFGPDGFLYIGFGDGGSGDDPLNSGQDTQSLLGKILRIDVDRTTPDRAYAIPADNPFAMTPAEGRAEIYAWGLRNPWRMSFDRQTGELWVGDVGQNAREEIDIVERGKNYGWKIMEGSRCRPGGPAECDTRGLEPPVVEYTHDVGRSVTGGYVYRGTRAPSLVGRYLYADYVTRVVFAWQRGEPAPTEPLLVAAGGIASFGEDEDGEVYALDLEGGRIFRFEESLGTAPAPPPERLSATGCFSDLAALTPVEGIVPYAIALGFWSDGAAKQRFVVLPEGGRITPSASGPWDFPIGTVFIKHFELASRRLETRFLIQEALGVRGFTYRWDDTGEDATLTTGAERFAVTSAAGTHDWHLPSRTDCTTCHRGRGVLGLESRQLGPSAETFAALGLLTAAPPAAPPLARPDEAAATLESKARAWLHVNCAYCHDGLGPSGTPLDLRVDTLLKDTGTCDAIPARGDLGIADARIIVPGDPDRSLLWVRTSLRDVHMMPPLATAIVDPDATLVRDWIAALEACP